MSTAVPDAWFLRVKSATRQLVDLCGGFVAAGEAAGITKSTMERAANPAHGDTLNVAQALALEAYTGRPLITQAMASLQGRRLSDPDEAGTSAGSILERTGALLIGAMEVHQSAVRAMDDGTLTVTELEIIDRDLRKLDFEGLQILLAGAKAARGETAETRAAARKATGKAAR